MTSEARILELERRVSNLEQARHGTTVRGWCAAARVLNVSTATVRRWFKTDPRFPRPARMRVFKGANERRISPEWSLASLIIFRT